MRKMIFLWIGVWVFSGIFLYSRQDDEVLKERVRVVNVEVPVRVYHQGKPVDNLTKSDFTLFEGGKRQEIHGFILKRKKIKVQDLELNAERLQVPQSRYFTLVFRITHFNDYLKKGLDYVFDRVLNESDQLLVFANDRSAFFKNLTDKNSIRKKLDQMLRDASLKARKKLVLYIKHIESQINKTKFEMLLRGSRQKPGKIYYDVVEYLYKILEIWKIYKKEHLIPDINKYYNFARFLKDIKIEKWVINFYQFEVFPDIMVNSDMMRKINNLIGHLQAMGDRLLPFVRMIEKSLIELEKEMSLANDFPSDEVAKIFHNVDVTFHSIFMKTSMSTLHEDFEYREIASELESSLRAITDRTGGKLVVSNKLDLALDEISKIEDLYYVLTYAPKNPDSVGKIKVKLRNRRYKLVYSPNLRTGYLSQFLEEKEIKTKPVQIQNLNFKKGKLIFIISDFFWNKKDGGALSIRIRILDPQGTSVFDQKKSIKASQNKINISLNLPGLKKGNYDVVVDVTDLFSKSSSTELLKITI